jgi:hypothetical protein
MGSESYVVKMLTFRAYITDGDNKSQNMMVLVALVQRGIKKKMGDYNLKLAKT